MIILLIALCLFSLYTLYVLIRINLKLWDADKKPLKELGHVEFKIIPLQLEWKHDLSRATIPIPDIGSEKPHIALHFEGEFSK